MFTVMMSASEMRRGFSQGVPLTPLMAKLSILANEPQTPIATPSTSRMFNHQLKSNRTDKDSDKVSSNYSDSDDDLDLKEMVLFVYGFNNMSTMLLMEPSCSQDPDQIHSIVSMISC